MKVAAFHRLLRDLPLTTPAAFTAGEPLVVLSPHPDDETLGTGGLIAAACAAGQRVAVVVLTDGAGSHPRSTSYPPARLIALRKAETAAAAAQLGLPPQALTHLDVPDTRAPLAGPAFEQAVRQVEAVLRNTGARRLMVTWGGDPHCDHEAAEAIARGVRRRVPGLDLWAYPIWGWHLDPEADTPMGQPEGFRLDIAPWAETKRRAIAAHASQMTDLVADDPEGFRFTPATLAPFLQPVETVFRVPHEPA